MTRCLKIIALISLIFGIAPFVSYAAEGNEETKVDVSSRLESIMESLKQKGNQGQKLTLISEASNIHLSEEPLPDECPICLEGNVDVQRIYRIDGCGHRFHQHCLITAVREGIYAQRFPTLCPVGNRSAQGCPRLTFGDVRGLGGDDLALNFLEGEIQQTQNLRICPLCKSFVSESTDSRWVKFCEVCNKNLCFICGECHSTDMSCFEYNDEAQKIAAIIYKNAGDTHSSLALKHCPTCGFPVERLEGCNAMVCGKNTHSMEFSSGFSGCGASFNWHSARPYASLNQPSDPLEVGIEGAIRRRVLNPCRGLGVIICACMIPAASLYAITYASYYYGWRGEP